MWFYYYSLFSPSNNGNDSLGKDSYWAGEFSDIFPGTVASSRRKYRAEYRRIKG